MTDTSFMQANRLARYRIAEYRNARDGSTVRIEESCRRASRVAVAEHSILDRRAELQRHQTLQVPSEKAFLNGERTHSSTPAQNVPSMWNDAEHVISVPKAKPQVVIIQSASSATPMGEKDKVPIRISTAPTPPPTPKIERLSTPELPDLEDSPFCDCCLVERTIKYCTSCGVELDRY